jgi:hypothetical protein
MKYVLVVLILLLPAALSAEIYRWKDSRGTVTYTNQPDSIPPKYRGSARVLPNMPGDQKKDQGPTPQGPAQQGSSHGQPPPPIALPLPPPAAAPTPSPVQQGKRPERPTRLPERGE